MEAKLVSWENGKDGKDATSNINLRSKEAGKLSRAVCVHYRYARLAPMLCSAAQTSHDTSQGFEPCSNVAIS